MEDRTLSTDMWTAIRASIVAVAPTITDGSTVKTASIKASYNDEETNKPQIIIYPVSPDETKDNFGSDFGSYTIDVRIDCRYSTSIAIDQLRDQVSYALSTTYIPGVELVRVSSDSDFAEVGDAKYHINVISATYTRD